MPNPIDNIPEVWKPVPNYESTYSVSNLGRVRSDNPFRKKKGTILHENPIWNGYVRVALYGGRKRHYYLVHRLVAFAFLEPPLPGQTEVNHLGGIRTHNWNTNLKWATPSENTRHAFDELGKQAPKGESHGNSKLTNEQVLEMRARRASGETVKALARYYGIHKETCRRIVDGKWWKHLIPPSSGISPSSVS